MTGITRDSSGSTEVILDLAPWRVERITGGHQEILYWEYL